MLQHGKAAHQDHDVAFLVGLALAEHLGLEDNFSQFSAIPDNAPGVRSSRFVRFGRT